MASSARLPIGRVVTADVPVSGGANAALVGNLTATTIVSGVAK